MFDLTYIMAMLPALFISIVESVGNYYTCAKISSKYTHSELFDDRTNYDHSVSKHDVTQYYDVLDSRAVTASGESSKSRYRYSRYHCHDSWYIGHEFWYKRFFRKRGQHRYHTSKYTVVDWINYGLKCSWKLKQSYFGF